MTVNIKPRNNIVIVQKEDTTKFTSGGVIRPFDDPAQPRIGTVLAVGPGMHDEEGNIVPNGFDVGDRIAWLRSHEKTFEVNHEDVIFVMGNGVLGKI